MIMHVSDIYLSCRLCEARAARFYNRQCSLVIDMGTVDSLVLLVFVFSGPQTVQHSLIVVNLLIFLKKFLTGVSMKMSLCE